MNFGDLHKKLRDGEALTDAELEFMYDHSKIMIDVLSGTGDVWYTAKKEAVRIHSDTRSMIDARQRYA